MQNPQSLLEHWFSLFNKAIDTYHILDNVDQEKQNPFTEQSLDALLFQKCWIDTVQWHLEDIVRDPQINPNAGMEIKRRIDASNQQRTDLVEKLDDEFIRLFDVPSEPSEGARLNTESLAWSIDRLSILALKIYHMEVEVARATEEKLGFLRAKRDLLLQQKSDLFLSISQLIDDVQNGVRYYKVYRQVKMYNDPSLNPVLYAKQHNSSS
jgi:hypothetical protein